MKLSLVGLGAVLVFMLSPLGASARLHGGVELTLDETLFRAGNASLSFVLQQEDGTEITDQDVVVSHERKLHMVIFDRGLAEYRHVHPEYSQGRWRVEAPLSVDGSYRVWAQGVLTDGDDFTGAAKLDVQGGASANAVPTALGDRRVVTDGDAIVTLSPTVFRAGRMASPTVTISRADGTSPVITPYLGAPAHITGTPIDSSLLVHVHPAAVTPDSPVLGLHVVFPVKGDYRVWAEFIESGVYHVVPLSVTVLP